MFTLTSGQMITKHLTSMVLVLSVGNRWLMMHSVVKRHVALTALFALMFMRFIDLAVFDMDHGSSHVQVHAREIAHSHDHDEPTEHETLDGKSAHIGFHTLLNVFIEVDAVAVPVLEHFTARYGLVANERAPTYGHRPPIPPPLA